MVSARQQFGWPEGTGHVPEAKPGPGVCGVLWISTKLLYGLSGFRVIWLLGFSKRGLRKSAFGGMSFCDEEPGKYISFCSCRA